jgi:hypothetical protein
MIFQDHEKEQTKRLTPEKDSYKKLPVKILPLAAIS